MFAWQGLPGSLLLLLLLLALIRRISIPPVAGASLGVGSTGEPRPGWHPTGGGERHQCVFPHQPVLAGDGSCLGGSPGISGASWVVAWPKASSGSVCAGWLPVLVQSTDDADGGHCQTPGLLSGPGDWADISTQVSREHPEVSAVMW